MIATAKLAGLGRDAQGIAIGVIALAAVGLAVYAWRKGPGGIAKDAGNAAGAAAGGLVIGTVTGIGEGIGIQKTDQTECERAIAEGRWWDASFACPAKRFISSIFGGAPASPPLTDQTQQTIDNAATNPGAEIVH